MNEAPRDTIQLDTKDVFRTVGQDDFKKDFPLQLNKSNSLEDILKEL